MTKKRKNKTAFVKRCLYCKHNAACIRGSKEAMQCINKNHARYQEKEVCKQIPDFNFFNFFERTRNL